MLKALFHVSPQITFEIEGKEQKDVFEIIGGLQEVFTQRKCGRCQSDVRFQVREVDDNKYYELVCTNMKCRAKKAFGVHKRGGSLFPKMKDEGGNYYPHDGWRTMSEIMKDAKPDENQPTTK